MMANDLTMLTVDTNVILRHLLNDQDDHSSRAAALFLKVRRGEQAVFCPDTAIFEAVHILTGRAGSPRDRTVAALMLLVVLPSFQMDHKVAVQNALEFWRDQPALDFADCYHLALTKELGMTGIYTFDRKMDRYPGVERIEPS
jgi:predicted nucleic acid-binding protein